MTAEPAIRGPDAPAPPPRESLLVAMLLSASGGFLDAFTWLDYGGVFANAQTGNAVLLGVYAALGQWMQAFRHLLPIAAFALGAFTASRLRARIGDHAAAVISLIIEIALLGLVMFISADFPGYAVTLGVSFVAALQNSSFGKVEGWRYNSVFTTGNLRQSVEALVAGMSRPRDRRALRQSAVFAIVCLTFVVGAGFGGFATARLGHKALGLPVAVLLLVLLLSLAEARPRRGP